MQNFIVLGDFVDHWRKDVTAKPFNTPIFHCDVVYSFRNQEVCDQTKAKIERTGYQEGTISLVETEVLSSHQFHLDFSPDFLDFELTDDKALKIIGSSDKMGGAYAVTITPIRPCLPGEYP